MKIIFWQNMPSHHQSGAIRTLASIWSGDVHGVYDTKMLPGRESLGWKSPDMGNVHCTFLDQLRNPAKYVTQFIKENPCAIHVLGGVRGSRSVQLAWRELSKKQYPHLACIAERPRFDGSLSSRYLAKAWYYIFFKRYSSRFKVFLAMSRLGSECFQSLGVVTDRIYPFLYQVDNLSSSHSNLTIDAALPAKPIRFVYVGRFDTCKGVDLILKAFEDLPGFWTLTWIGGGGPLESVVKASVDGERVTYIGSVPSDEVIETLQRFDVCLTPSRYDGWGMVTNEALIAGRGVVTSDAVGSSELVSASGSGKVIRAGCVATLRRALLDILSRPEQVVDWSHRAVKYQQVITPEVAGLYLKDVLSHAFISTNSCRPVAPWLQRAATSEIV